MAAIDSRGTSHESRHETSLERLDGNLEEMTGELRVVDEAFRRRSGSVHRRRRLAAFTCLWFAIPLARLRALEHERREDSRRTQARRRVPSPR